MKKIFLVLALLVNVLVGSALAADTTGKKGAFNLVHWNILKKVYQINSYMYTHHQSLARISSDHKFLSLLNETFTPDSYAAIFDQGTVTRIHPNKSIVGKKMSTVNQEVLAVMQKAIQRDTCVRSFYIWIDKEEKYMVVCPLIGETSDGYKLFYAYTMYTRSIPDYYMKTLKESVLE